MIQNPFALARRMIAEKRKQVEIGMPLEERDVFQLDRVTEAEAHQVLAALAPAYMLSIMQRGLKNKNISGAAFAFAMEGNKTYHFHYDAATQRVRFKLPGYEELATLEANLGRVEAGFTNAQFIKGEDNRTYQALAIPEPPFPGNDIENAQAFRHSYSKTIFLLADRMCRDAGHHVACSYRQDHAHPGQHRPISLVMIDSDAYKALQDQFRAR